MRDLIKKFPYPIKQGLKYIYGAIPPKIRLGKVFWETYNFLQESQWWSKEKIEEYQFQQSKKIILHAYNNVPGYKDLFDKYSLNPDLILSMSDIKKFPFITKEDLRDSLEKFVAKNYPPNQLEYLTTGGSTAIPFGFYHLKQFNWPIEWAFFRILWERVDYHERDKCISFAGAFIANREKNKYWEYNPVNRWLSFSVYHLIEPYISKYIKKIKEFRPDFIHGYPSAITILANYILENKIKDFPSIKAILCGSENLYDWQRELFEKVFKCRVFNWYGHAEKVVLAGECEYSYLYHVFPEYGLTEIVDKDGKEITREGEVGEIVGTSFYNLAVPFIRYKTRDLAVVTNNKCQCGRNYRLLKRVEGRLQEMIVTRDNRYISMTAINMHSNVFDNVRQFQFYQEKKGEVVFQIVKKDTYTAQDTENIKRALLKKFGGETELIIRFVNNIPLAPSGKYRFLVQKLKLGFGD